MSEQQQSQSSHKSKHDDGSQETSVVGQLEYGCEGCDGVRVVELVGRVEDLTFQLTTTQEELQQALERSNQAEVMSTDQGCVTLYDCYTTSLCK